ncbi:MAG: AAA family ATPase, partial [Gammaproteobacteria bacterium]|nr:AAA family ATPase [Gammaproteobacteria bacterium]
RRGPVRRDRLAMRIESLGRHLRLTRTDINLLELLIRYRSQGVIENFLDQFSEAPGRRGCNRWFLSTYNPALAAVLSVSAGHLRGRLSSESPLIVFELVHVHSDGEITASDCAQRLVDAPASCGTDSRHVLFGNSPAPQLTWQDFDHVADQRDHIERLIQGAVRARRRGVNILIYGPPGTGKTEFCRTLAERLGLVLHSVGESDVHGKEPTRRERIGELRLAQRMFGDGEGSLMLFDEMEDVLSSSSGGFGYFGMRERGSGGSKVFLNRLLEENALPVLWTTNSARNTCPTILRRMMYAMELRLPSPRIRGRIWARELERQGIPTRSGEAESLGREFEVAPSVAAGATAAAGLIEGGDIETVRKGVLSLSRLLYGNGAPQRKMDDFDISLVRGDCDLRQLARSLTSRGKQRQSLLLQGPPGTGKSAFVRHLAELMGLEVAQRRASDLLSMWVGGTEANIAGAFEDARDQAQFLVFDEADSLLADRRHAQRNWEVSQVNEMLTWMESHPLPFACTTNFGERLDHATLRRFDFKIQLDYLAPEQIKLAFRAFFDLELPAGVQALRNLTPGDFAVVRRRAEVLGKQGDAKALAEMLREECEIKPDRPKQIGFAA